MNKCPYFNIETQEFRTNPIGGRPVTNKMQIPWCSHKHSPAPSFAINTIGFETKLTCGGDSTKCQVPQHKFSDQ